MNFSGQLFSKQLVDRAMSSEQALPLEGMAHQRDVEMRIGRALGVAVAFVGDVKVAGLEGGLKFGL